MLLSFEHGRIFQQSQTHQYSHSNEMFQEILYSEMEHGDGGYENDLQDFDDGHGDPRKGSMEMVLADVVEPLDVDDAAHNDAGSGDDQDLDFIDDDMTE